MTFQLIILSSLLAFKPATITVFDASLESQLIEHFSVQRNQIGAGHIVHSKIPTLYEALFKHLVESKTQVTILLATLGVPVALRPFC